MRLVKENPREDKDFHFGIVQAKALLHNIQTPKIVIMEFLISKHNRDEFIDYAIVKNLASAPIENALAIQVVFNITTDIGTHATTFHEILKTVHRLTATLVGNGSIFIATINPLTDIFVVRLLNKRRSLVRHHLIFFFVDFRKMSRKRVEDSRHTLLRENPNTVVSFGKVLGIANDTNPIFVGFEQNKVKGGLTVVIERQQGICDTFKIIRPHYTSISRFRHKTAYIYRLFNTYCQILR